MNELNVVNDTQQAVVEPASEQAAEGAEAAGTPAVTGNAEPTVRKQSAAENSGYRKLRLENEGYKKEIEQLRQKLEGLSEADSVKSERDRYLDVLIRQKMTEDLSKIRSLDPKVESLEGLGDEFIRLIECGVDAKVAYRAVTGATDGKEKPAPPTLSSIGASEGVIPRYYTSAQLDRLTARDLENPAVYKKAMESLKRL